MDNYLSLDQIDSIIKNGKFPIFSLYYLVNSYSKPIPARTFALPDTKVKADITDEMAARCTKELHHTLEDYKKIPGAIFRVTFKEFGSDHDYGPHDFILADQAPPSKEVQQPLGGLMGVNGLGMTELTQLMQIHSKSALNDYREALLLEKELKLKADIEQFEKDIVNPAAKNISKGVGLALTKFFNAIVPDAEEVPLAGTETEATKAAEELANDLITSGCTASDIKDIHKIIKENKIKEEKTE